MNPDSDDQTRQFLEQLIDRRRSDNVGVLASRRSSSMDIQQHENLLRQERQIQMQQHLQLLRRRNSLQSSLKMMSSSRPHHNINSSPMSASRFVDEPQLLRGESSRFPGAASRLGMMQRQQLSKGIILGTMGSPSVSAMCGAGKVYPSLKEGMIPGGIRNWNAATDFQKRLSMAGNLKWQPKSASLSAASFGFPSPLAGAMANRGALGSGMRLPSSPFHRSLQEMFIPRIKDSQFFLPSLPTTTAAKRRSGKRKIKASLKSYKSLWRHKLSAYDSLYVRKELFSRAVSRATVKIRDNSKTLPPTPLFRPQFAGSPAVRS